MTRLTKMRAFLDQTPWKGAAATSLNGDASNRRYHRLTSGPSPALVMDADPAYNGSIQPFLDIAALLRDCGLSAPQVYASDTAQGFALIEDFGDDLYARVVQAAPETEYALYTAAADVLLHLHHAPAPQSLPLYDSAMMGEMAALALHWYAPKPDDIQKHMARCVAELCQRVTPKADRIAQRDYHAENLVWLAQRSGIARVGLLDFQDAMAAPAPYDLVSLLSDARRDVSPETITQIKDHYRRNAGLEHEAFEAAYDLCGAQRSLRILGVFARLWLRDGKAGYLPLMPRVWQQLQTHLQHPALHQLKTLCDTHLSPPSEAFISNLKQKRTTP